MPTKFAIIAVWAEDVTANVHFYRDVLDWSLYHIMVRVHILRPMKFT